MQDTIVAVGPSDDDQIHVSNVQEGFQESTFSSDFTQVSILTLQMLLMHLLAQTDFMCTGF